MADTTYLDWPFFEPHHAALARELDEWAHATLPGIVEVEGAEERLDDTCRALVRALGEGGWLRYCVTGVHGGMHEALDVRSLSIIRETLAPHSGLADFAFAMQGLGSGAISQFGSDELCADYLPAVARGEKIAAFALSEEDAGSDAAAMRSTLRQEAGELVLDGEKLWISNGGIADFYCVFARGDAGVGAVVVDADAPGLSIPERIDVMAPHPLARLRFDGVRLPHEKRIGEEGKGFKVAL